MWNDILKACTLFSGMKLLILHFKFAPGSTKANCHSFCKQIRTHMESAWLCSVLAALILYRILTLIILLCDYCMSRSNSISWFRLNSTSASGPCPWSCLRLVEASFATALRCFGYAVVACNIWMNKRPFLILSVISSPKAGCHYVVTLLPKEGVLLFDFAKVNIESGFYLSKGADRMI